MWTCLRETRSRESVNIMRRHNENILTDFISSNFYFSRVDLFKLLPGTLKSQVFPLSFNICINLDLSNYLDLSNIDSSRLGFLTNFINSGGLVSFFQF